MELMEYKNEITEDNIQIIQNVYKIKIITIKQLFIGADKNTFVYTIESKNCKYFLKLRIGDFNESSIVLPYVLSQNIGEHIIEPIKTIDDQLYYRIKNCVFILYPFINGKSGFEKDLSREQWLKFGKFMNKMHTIQLQNYHNIQYEKWNTKWSVKLRKYLDNVYEIEKIDKYVKQFVTFIDSKRAIINEILIKTEELNIKVKNYENNYCLCHGDIHAGNIFIAEDNNFYIVDWDTLIMAPKERDLMFIGGGIGNKWNNKIENEYFYKGYGKRDDINKTIMVYYRNTRGTITGGRYGE